MAPLGYLKIFRRRWRVILACFVIAAVTGYILSPEEPATPEGSGYQATLTLVPSVEAETGPNLHLAAYLATTHDVASLAAQELPADVRPRNAEAITAGVNAEAGAMTITATDPDQARAGALAAAYAAATIEFFQTTTTVNDDDELAAAQAQLAAIEDSIAGLEDELRRNPDDPVLQARLETELTQYSTVSQRVQDLLGADQNPPALQVLGTPQINELEGSIISAPEDRRARALLAGVLGLLLGLGVAIAVDRFDTRLRERDDVEDALGLPVLGEIPRIGRRTRANHALLFAVRPASAVAEAYRSLRSAITLVAQGRRTDGDGASSRVAQQTHQVLVVTGAMGHEGKSTTVVNLAAAFAETDRSVIVIDCDFRKPEAHLFLGVSPRPGLAEVMEGSLTENADQLVRSTAIRGVSLVTAGKAMNHPAGAFPRLAGIVADARRRADVVLIDSSPLLAVSEAIDVLQYADAALVACRLGRTTYEQARRSRELLDRAEVPLLGVVLTGTARRRGTPYGEPNRSQSVRSMLATWMQSAGHVPSSNGATADAMQEHAQEERQAGQDDQSQQERRPRQPAKRPYQRRHERSDRRSTELRYERQHERLDQWPAVWHYDSSIQQATGPYSGPPDQHQPKADGHHRLPDEQTASPPDELTDERPADLKDGNKGERSDQRPADPRGEAPDGQDNPPEKASGSGK